MVKTPLYPFTIWLPKAHSDSPLSGSVILAAMFVVALNLAICWKHLIMRSISKKLFAIYIYFWYLVFNLNIISIFNILFRENILLNINIIKLYIIKFNIKLSRIFRDHMLKVVNVNTKINYLRIKLQIKRNILQTPFIRDEKNKNLGSYEKGNLPKKNEMNSFYVTRFTDAEGCFTLDISNLRGKNWSAAARFAIKLHIADIDILYKIKTFFGGIGSVKINGKTAIYRVSKITDIIKVIIPHFKKYPLQSAKFIEFKIWKKSAVLINNKEHLTEEGILKINSLKSGLNKGLSAKLDMSMYKIYSASNLNPYWVSGFIDGDGSFTVNIESKTNYVNLRLIIDLNQRETFLIHKISEFFGGVGRINFSSDKQLVYYTISNIKDINAWVLPHFDNYILIGHKNVNYLIWKDIFMKVKSKAHLTQEGINQITELRLKLNKYSDELNLNNACLSHNTDLTTLEFNNENSDSVGKKEARTNFFDSTGAKGSRSYSTNSYGNFTTPKTVVGINSNLSSYLAGLIEGDGCLYTPKNIKNAAIIQITFNSKDYPFISSIQENLRVGNIYKIKGKNAYSYTIGNIKGLIKIINLINGYMRTSKIMKLHKLIDFINNKGYNIIKLPLDNSLLNSNAWLSGFIDADGSFYIRVSQNKHCSTKKIACMLVLTQTKNIVKEKNALDIMNKISKFLDNKLILRTKKYWIRTNKLKSNLILNEYLINFPLFSSKYLDYLNWSKVLNIIINKEHKKNINKIVKLKGSMNSNRKYFNWDHLKNLYNYLDK
jgi:hypothetical protein